MRHRASLVSGLCVGVVALASACGGGGNTTEAEIRADQLLRIAPSASGDLDDLSRVGEWSRNGDILTAWVRVKPTTGKPFVSCAAVDTTQRIDNDDDVRLAVTPIQDSYCHGAKPKNVATGTTETAVATADPMTCLEDAELSDVEQQGSDFWRGNHDDPFYQVNVDLLPSKADAQQAVADAVDVYAALAGTYMVTGPLTASAEGSQLSADDGVEADALVQEVATCLGV